MSLGKANEIFVEHFCGFRTLADQTNQWLKNLPDDVELIEVRHGFIAAERDHDEIEATVLLVCRKARQVSAVNERSDLANLTAKEISEEVANVVNKVQGDYRKR